MLDELVIYIRIYVFNVEIMVDIVIVEEVKNVVWFGFDYIGMMLYGYISYM